MIDWIEVSHCLPEINGIYLVCVENNAIDFAKFIDSYFVINQVIVDVTHWSELNFPE